LEYHIINRQSLHTYNRLRHRLSRTAGTAGKASVEFADENTLLFTQDGLYMNDETQSEKALWCYRFDTKTLAMLPMPLSGDIRRQDIDQKVYIAAKGDNNKLLTLNNPVFNRLYFNIIFRRFKYHIC
jgi:hypothetical protein